MQILVYIDAQLTFDMVINI